MTSASATPGTRTLGAERGGFHPGEQAVQARYGLRDQLAPWGRKALRPYLTEQLRGFFPQLPFVVAAARDAAGRPWVTLLAGEPGFVSSPDPRSLAVHARLPVDDALAGRLVAGAQVGLLGIDLATRRRHRVNGRITSVDGGAALHVTVEQAFGNCPQYIVERVWVSAPAADPAPAARRAPSLDDEAAAWIERADTAFLGTGVEGEDADDPRFGLDVSHRGGSPGFVAVLGPAHVVIPDYAGNHYFNTLGNLALDPRIAVTFVDFERGSLLQLTGRAEVDFDPAPSPRFPGAQRLVHVDVEEVVRLDGALPLRWRAPGGRARQGGLVLGRVARAAGGRSEPR